MPRSKRVSCPWQPRRRPAITAGERGSRFDPNLEKRGERRPRKSLFRGRHINTTRQKPRLKKVSYNKATAPPVMIKKQRTAVAQVLLTELRLEGLRDRQLARFACDDDVPRVPQAPLTPAITPKQ